MSLLTAMYSSASGLNATTDELSVVGDNISNSQTVGFKASRADFADAMTQEMVAGQGEQGLGVRTLTVQKLMAQGSFTTTNQDTDVAIEGNGMFVLKGSYGGTSGTYYTRDGQFTIDKNGYLVNEEGLRVQGMQADTTGNVSSGLLGDLQVGNASAPAKATDDITVRGNLDSRATPTEATWDVTNAKDTSNFSTSMVVYDSLGKPVQLDVYFCMDSVGDWHYHAVTDGANLTGGTPNTATEVATGELKFDTEGRLTSNTTTLNNFNPINATNPQPLTFDFGTGTDTGGSGLDGITQYASDSAMSFVTQAGFTSGSLSKLSIGSDGTITGGFTNGQSRALGQLVLGNFAAPDQLARTGGSLYQETVGSGPGTLGTPATADRGSISAGALEQSNVDLSQEFINMIAAQRSFEADSKTLTTADQLLSDLMMIHRQ
ncbi:MAG: flagellar hook protein FlgE [Polyangia bacterium]